MSILNTKYSWLAAPALWLLGVLCLLAVWAIAAPEWIALNFDNDGVSPVESATVGLFFFLIAFMWLLPPMRRGPQRVFWLSILSLIVFIAICRELDWHRLMITGSEAPEATRGTPFKMRFLTNPANLTSDRLIVLTSFVLAIALCGGTLAYFLRRLLRGLFKLHPVCWSVAFIGGTGILVNITDRMPSILRKHLDITLAPKITALFTALEEGQELLLPLLAILAIMQAYFIYNSRDCDPSLVKFREM